MALGHKQYSLTYFWLSGEILDIYHLPSRALTPKRIGVAQGYSVDSQDKPAIIQSTQLIQNNIRNVMQMNI